MSFPSAQIDYELNPDQRNGVGILMEKEAGLVVVDLDSCYSLSGVEPWARDLIDMLDTYTELSPSGAGFRIVGYGALEQEFSDHRVGLEFYDGTSPRFLTITGHVLPDHTEVKVIPPTVLAWCAMLYRPRNNYISSGLPLPILTDPPPFPESSMTTNHLRFLQTGEVIGFPSRSELIQSMAAKLYTIGYEDHEVLALLWSNSYVQETCADHRQGDQDRGMHWLWYGVQKVRERRRKRPEEVFQSLRSDKHQELYEDLRDRMMRLPPGGEVRDLLKEMALLDLDAFEREQLIQILKQVGHSKQTLLTLLRQYEAEARPKAAGIPWVHWSGEAPNDRPLGTIENLALMLQHHKVRARHNLMDHRVHIEGPEIKFEGEERFNNQLSQVRSWAAQHRLPLETIREQLVVLARQNEYHPFAEFLEGTRWDGRDRIQEVIDTIHVDHKRRDTRDHLVRRWLVSIVASVYGYHGRAPRGVLTFVGPQQTGKTTWLRYLVPKGMYHQGLILRADQRDSATKGLRYLVVEIGEVGTTFRRQDIETLKSYLGQHEDVYRLSYAADESVWQRRTVFAASANNMDLLRDQTGNTRWWTVAVNRFDLNEMERRWGSGEGRALKQFWAQVKVMYDQGEPWDLSDRELVTLEETNEEFREETLIESMLRDVYAWDTEPPKGGYPVPRREMDILKDLGLFGRINRQDAAALRQTLRYLTGMSRPVMRRVDMATVDGQTVGSDWSKKGKKDSQIGRWWLTPPRRGESYGEESKFKG